MRRRFSMRNNGNAISFGFIAGILTLYLTQDASLVVTNVLLGLIAGKLLDNNK